MPRKILIITGDAGESYEALYAVHAFAKRGTSQWWPPPRNADFTL